MKPRRVQKLRNKIGWTQHQMAQAMGIMSFKTISHWENGFRTPTGISQRLLKLLEALSSKELEIVTTHLEKLSQEGRHADK